MKKLLLILTICFAGFGFTQSFSGKGSKVHSVSLNSNHFHHINHNWSNGGSAYGFIGQGDYGLHPYLSLGWQGSIGWGRFNANAWSRSNTIYFSGGATFNFHFYQLISDKSGENIYADQLDIYAGVNLGAGFGLSLYEDFNGNRSSEGFPVVYGGPHLGIRWYPNAGNIGIQLEGGYGKSYASLGVVFR